MRAPIDPSRKNLTMNDEMKAAAEKAEEDRKAAEDKSAVDRNASVDKAAD